MFTRKRHRRGVVLPARTRTRRCARRWTSSIACSGSVPARAEAGSPLGDPVSRLPYRPLLRAVRRLHLEEDYRKVIDGVIEFLSGETRPIIRELEHRMADAASDWRFEAARFEPSLLGSASRQRQAARQAPSWTVDVVGIAIEGASAAVRSSPSATGRWSTATFASGPIEGRMFLHCWRRSCSSTTARHRRSRRRSSRPARGGGHVRAAEFLSERPWLACGGARVRRGESVGCRSWRTRTQGLRSRPTPRGRSSRGFRVGRSEELREVLHLETSRSGSRCFDVSNIQEESPVASVVVFQDATPKHYRVRHPREGRAGRLRGARRGRLAALRPVGRRRRRSTTKASRWRPPRRDRRREGSAVGSDPGDAGVRPAAGRGDLARQARRGGVRADRPEPIRLERHSPGLQLLQRIRDEAHRFALGFHRQRRDAEESIFDTLPVGPARRRALLKHFGSAEQFVAATQESSRASRASRRRRRARLAQLHKAGRA